MSVLYLDLILCWFTFVIQSSYVRYIMMTQLSPAILDNRRFTEHELELIQMVAYEYDEIEMATELRMSLSDVNNLLEGLFQKMKVTNTPGLIRVAFEQGILLLVQGGATF